MKSRVGLGCLLVLLGAVAWRPAGAGARKHSEEFQRLRRESYGLVDSLEHPDRWREAVAQQKAHIAKVEAVCRERPELADELRPLIGQAQQSLAYDGVDFKSVNVASGGPGDPFGDALDVVAWVEEDHLRVAVGNPGNAAKKAAVSLRQYARRKPVPEWPAVAATEVELEPDEVVVVHFDGIPTTGEKSRDNDYSFTPWVALLEEGREPRASAVFVQSAGRWGGELERYVARAGEAAVVVPGREGVRYAHDYLLYVPKRARARRSAKDLELRPDDAAGLIEADHGFFLRKRIVRFVLTLPEPETYDLVRVRDLVGRVHGGSEIMADRAVGPRILVLGKATRVRQVTVPLPDDHRLDAEPLSDDPARRAEQLAARLGSGLWQIRRHAEQQLAALGAPAVPTMVALVCAQGYRGRDSASAILTRIGEPAIEPVGKLLTHKDWQPRFEGARVLGRIGGRGVDILLNAALHQRPDVRRAAVEGLRVSHDARAVEGIAKLAKDTDKEVRGAAVAAAAEVGSAKERLASLLRGLEDPAPNVRTAAIYGLVSWNAPDAWPRINATQDERAARIAAMLRDADADVREAAATALGGLRDPRTVQALLAATRDRSATVRRSVAFALKRIAEKPGGVSAHLVGEATAAALALLRDAEEDARMWAAYLLGYLKARTAAEPLARALDDGSEHVREAAAHALKALGYQLEESPGHRFRLVGPVAVAPLPEDAAALRALLASEDKALAYRAAEALARRGGAGLTATWVKLLGSDDFAMRAVAAEALGRIGDKEAVKPLLAALDDPRTEVRRKAIWALGELKAPEALDPLFERYVNRRGGDLRAKGVYGDHGEYSKDFDALEAAVVKFGEPVIPRLIPLAEAGWSRMEDSARAALVRIGKPAVSHLITALEDPDHRARAGAARVLGQLKPSEAVLPLLKTTEARDYEGRQAFEALCQYGKAAGDGLRAGLQDPGLKELARGSAAVLLLALGDASGQAHIETVVAVGDKLEMNELVHRMGTLRRREFLPFIEQALERPDAWQGVAYAAAYCGGKDAIPMLRKALKHPSNGVRRGARSWIERLSERE